MTKRAEQFGVEAGVNNVFNTGGSLGVILPKRFTEAWDIRKGDPITFVIVGDSIRFIPMDKNSPVIRALRLSDGGDGQQHVEEQHTEG